MGAGALAFVLMGICRPLFGGMGFHGHHPWHSQSGFMRTTGIFTGSGLVLLCAATTSAIFAGIRRSTGLTFRRQLSWPPFDLKTGEKILAWYDSRLAQINEKAEERIRVTIERHGPGIEDPAVRALWEEQVRKDVMEKVERIKARRRHCAEFVERGRQGHREKQRKHYPLLALYLYVGEKLFDYIVCWMSNNPHFCYESADADSLLFGGSDNIEELLAVDGASVTADNQQQQQQQQRLLTPWEPVRAKSSTTMPYIASSSIGSSSSRTYPAAGALLDQSGFLQPEPSAPELSESQFLALKTTSGSAGPPMVNKTLTMSVGSSSDSASASPHINSLGASSRHRSAPVIATADPPPYTPLDERVVCEHSDEQEDGENDEERGYGTKSLAHASSHY
ncbi:hypothetical protein GGI07_000733 [Coemansia sp. Benny D115]|nr:hypothetical protein GGI07_000733 [Coemansia sp. Benny D115]